MCDKVGMFWEATEWVDYKRRVKPERANDLAFAQDGSDYSACLITRPQFYCNQFEVKP